MNEEKQKYYYMAYSSGFVQIREIKNIIFNDKSKKYINNDDICFTLANCNTKRHYNKKDLHKTILGSHYGQLILVGFIEERESLIRKALEFEQHRYSQLIKETKETEKNISRLREDLK